MCALRGKLIINIGGDTFQVARVSQCMSASECIT